MDILIPQDSPRANGNTARMAGEYREAAEADGHKAIDHQRAVNSNPERIVFLDWLRVIACLMVMCIHAAEPFYLSGEAPNVTHIATRWDAMWIAITEGVCRVAVPLFVMASSYLLFPLRGTTGAFFKRRLVRIAVPFFLWAVAYTAVLGGDLRQLFFNFTMEGGHLWFVPMIAGLYVLMPLLSPWAERVGDKELRCWIGLWLATTTLPFIRRLWSVLFGDPPFGAVPYLWGECPWSDYGAFYYVCGFVGYMLAGLWFRKFGPLLSWRKTLSIAVPVWIAGFAVIALPFYLAIPAFPFSAPYSTAVQLEMSIQYDSLGVALASIAVFMIVRTLGFGGWFYARLVRPLSEASYGMYLMHMFILTPVFAALSPYMATPLAILATAAATFSLTAVAATLIRRIPLLGRLVCG